MKPEKRLLLDDLLNDDFAPMRRQTTLRAGSQALQRRHLLRVGFRLAIAGSLAAVIVAASLREFLSARQSASPNMTVASSDPAPRMTAQVEFLTDDQLLALFPGTPVGLGNAGGRQWLLFPRAGDESRFIVDAQRDRIGETGLHR